METGTVYIVTKSNIGGTFVTGDVFYKSLDGRYHNITCDTVYNDIGEIEYKSYSKCVCLIDENDNCHVYNTDYVRSVLNELSK